MNAQDFMYMLYDWRGDLLDYIADTGNVEGGNAEQVKKISEQIRLINNITPDAQQAWFELKAEQDAQESESAQVSQWLDVDGCGNDADILDHGSGATGISQPMIF